MEEDLVYQWKVLIFGPATTSRVFTKLLATVAAHLHLQRCLMYIYTEIFDGQASLHQVFCTCDINLAQLVLIPSQVMLHLGVMI